MAEVFIEEDCKKFNIYTYKSMQLRENIIEQLVVIENCLKVVNNET